MARMRARKSAGGIRGVVVSALVLVSIAAADSAARAPSRLSVNLRGEQASGVRVGIDVWRQRGFAPLTGKRIGLISNLTGRDSSGRLTAEVRRM